MTALHLAVSSGHRQVAEYLVDSGAHLDVITVEGAAIHYAIVQGDVAIVKYLIKKGADINIESGYKNKLFTLNIDPLFLPTHRPVVITMFTYVVCTSVH